MSKYIVINENVLGYRQPWQAYPTAGILRASVTKGASHIDRLQGDTPIKQGDTVRDATAEDFDVFNVKLPPDFQSF